MENCIIINNQRIELTREQVRQIIAAQTNPAVQLSEIAEGDTFKIGEHEFIVLEQIGEDTAVIRKDLLPDATFGENNKYNDSGVDKLCCAFADEIESIIGGDKFVLHTVDLTANDGLKDYGQIRRRASLLTAERYRRYVEILDKFKPDRWWWLATPYSTEKHENSSWVLCVAPSGYIFNDDFCSYDFGVRPFCILKSTIFVSK